MKILITGGTGFIGRKLTQTLHQKDYPLRVTGLDERPFDLPEEVEHYQADLREFKEAMPAFENVDVCINLAARVGPVGYMAKYAAEIWDDNNRILSATFRAAKERGIKRMYFASSSMVFQNSSKETSKEEDVLTIPPPTNIYGFSKLLGEYYCRAYAEQFGLVYTIFRLFNVYGVGERLGKELGFSHVIPDIAKRILFGQYPLEILGDGKQTRSFTHVDDIVAGIVLLVEKEKETRNEDYNLGSSRETSILELAKMLWKICGRKEPFKVKHLPEFSHPTAYRRAVDNSKIRALGWKETVKLEDGLKEVVEWLREQS